MIKTVTPILLTLFLLATFAGAADFGYTTGGSSEYTLGTTRCQANVADTYTASAGDTVTALAIQAHSYGSARTLDIGIYLVVNDSAKTRVGYSELSIEQSSPAVWTEVSGLSIALVAGSTYCIGTGNVSGSVRIMYDTEAGSESRDTTTTTLPATWSTAPEIDDHRYAFRATYSESSGTPAISSVRRRKLLTESPQ